MSAEDYAETEKNLKAVVSQGRDPALLLDKLGHNISLPDWADSLFTDMQAIAAILDKANNCQDYSEALTFEWRKIRHPELTPSAKMLALMLEQQVDNGVLGLQLAEQYKQEFMAADYVIFSEQELIEQAQISLQKQTEIEAQDVLSFDDFLADYFSQKQAMSEAS
jgi:glutamate--cysteine ligase